MSYRPIIDPEEPDLLTSLYFEGPEPEWPAVDPISEQHLADYPNRVMIEHLCERCGQGFSSIKPAPRFCTHECYLASPEIGERVAKLWHDPEFVSKIRGARAVAGYPDKNRPEAVARRKARGAAKNTLLRCLKRSGAAKDNGTFLLLGYSQAELIRHLEAQFSPGMNWQNHGAWEIDHKRPIANFPLSASIAEINALSNLQPLWKVENRKKGARYG